MKIARIILSAAAVMVAVAGTFASAGRLVGRQVFTKPSASLPCTIKTGCFTGTGTACTAVIGTAYVDGACSTLYTGAIHKE